MVQTLLPQKSICFPICLYELPAAGFPLYSGCWEAQRQGLSGMGGCEALVPPSVLCSISCLCFFFGLLPVTFWRLHLSALEAECT